MLSNCNSLHFFFNSVHRSLPEKKRLENLRLYIFKGFAENKFHKAKILLLLFVKLGHRNEYVMAKNIRF